MSAYVQMAALMPSVPVPIYVSAIQDLLKIEPLRPEIPALRALRDLQRVFAEYLSSIYHAVLFDNIKTSLNDVIYDKMYTIKDIYT